MTENTFRLPTLHLGTDFDEPTVPKPLPAHLHKGADRGLCILDGADRAPHRLSRMVRSVGLLGVKIDRPETAVRVKMVLLADLMSTTMWFRERRRIRKSERSAPRDRDGVLIAPDLSKLHRLVEVSAQGVPRALALLSYRHSDGEETRTRVEFEMSADEVGPSGLLMFDLQEPAFSPSWAQSGRLEGGLTGVCIVRIEITPIGDDVPARLSTGRPDVDGREVVGRRPGYTIVNPAADGSAATLLLTPRWADDERLLGRRAKVKHPVRFVQEWSSDRRLSVGSRASIDVVDTAGNTVLSSTVSEERDGSYAVPLPAGVGPVYVRARKHLGGGEPAPINWWAQVRR